MASRKSWPIAFFAGLEATIDIDPESPPPPPKRQRKCAKPNCVQFARGASKYCSEDCWDSMAPLMQLMCTCTWCQRQSHFAERLHRQRWLVSVAQGLIQEARDSSDADSEISDFAPTDENSCDADSENSDFEPTDEIFIYDSSHFYQ